MQNMFDKKVLGNCPVCGKVVPKRDIRDKRASYCSRVCAGLGRFSTRYQGSNSGPLDRPTNIKEKTKFEQSDNS